MLTISGGEIKQATGGEATGSTGTGGHGIYSSFVNILGGIITRAKGGNATDTNSGDGGTGIASDGALTIHSGNIGTAQGGTSANGTGGSGIRSGDTFTISDNAAITNATGGTSTNGTGGNGIYSRRELKIDGGAAITNATGGSGWRGGHGLYGSVMKIISSTIGTAKGGEGKTSGGNGIYGVGKLTIQKATITNATGIDGTGGNGIFSDGKLSIEKATIKEATGGNADNSTGGSGIRGDGSSNDFKLSIDSATITNATGGSGKWGGSGILGKTMEILTSTIKKATGGRSTGKESYHTGGAGISSYGGLTIQGGTTVQAVGGNADSGTGGSGIRSGSLSISGGTISATGGSGKSGGAGIDSSGTVSISDGKIEQAAGGRATGEDGTGGSGIRSNGTLTIKGGEIQQTAGGDATGKGGTGGSGIHSGSVVKIWGGTITKATGGSGKSGGDGIGSYGALTISGSAKIETAQGGASADGNGGSGISSGGILTIEGSANIGTAQGGASTNGTGGSGKSGGAGVSTESGIVSIGNSDTPLDLTATAPDADNAIRGRDGKKLDEIIHLKENGKRGLVKLVENGVTRLFHNGVYTKSIYPAGSETHPLGDWVITKKPTCTEKGERQRSCKVEHCVVTETEELPALGHQWSGWMPVQGDSSREYRICAVCKAVEYRDVSHNSDSGDSTISTGLRVLDPAQADILQNAQLVRLSQISDVLYIDVSHETASLQGVLSDLTGLRSERIGTVVFSTERCTSTLSLSDVAALGAGDTPFTLRHSGSTASFIVGGADHSALLR